MSKADQKSSHKLVGILIQFLMVLGANMAGFWRGLGGQVGAMLGPNAAKAGPKNQSKKSSLFGRPPAPILMNFWWILAPTWGGQGGPTNQCFGDYVGSWSQDAPKISPRAPQDAPTGSQCSLKNKAGNKPRVFENSDQINVKFSRSRRKHRKFPKIVPDFH